MQKWTITRKGAIYTFNIEDILYMEKQLRKIVIHVYDEENDCAQIIDYYGKFSQIEPFLDDRFLNCHRSYIINMDAIIWMGEQTIYLMTNISVEFGRDTFYEARRLFTAYLRRKFPDRKYRETQWR